MSRFTHSSYVSARGRIVAGGSDDPAGPGERFLPLERYGLIGSAGTAALVSDDGSIDWLCLPRFDSDPVFARLLDPSGGHFSVRPAGPFSAARRYVEETAILATTFTTPGGRATLYDFFPARPAAERRRRLWPSPYLVRRLEGESGTVDFEVEVAPADAFSGRPVRLRASGPRLQAALGGASVFVESSGPFSLSGGRASARIRVGAGERRYAALSYADRDLGVLPAVGGFAERAFHDTLDYWRRWVGQERLGGRGREAVRRSALTLKLLTFAPSGGVVAAPTTSLPEVVGGVRNWDYRYVWIRDASWTIRALFDVGFEEEARAYLFWATNAARLTQPRVDTTYTLYGSRRLREREIDGLTGYRGSRPVRRGNAAVDQLQLDNWGHLVEAAYVFARREDGLEPETWRSIRAFVQFVAESWRRPDHGIWEVRGEPRHYVHSKVMCWVALDRGVRLAREFGLRGPTQAWGRERDAVGRAVLERGVDPIGGFFVRSFGDREVDASLLQIPIVGFLDGDDERVLATIDRIRRDLGREELVFRYVTDDGLPGHEGAFVACSFWLAHALALAGREEEACDVFDRACGRASGLGLLPEEIDLETGAFLGNFPQGLSHIALLNAAAALEHVGG